MRYFLNYQHLPKGGSRPIDEGATVEVQASDVGGFALLPNVGDFVNLDNSTNDMASFKGRVRSRFSGYVAGNCLINIVVVETEVDWGSLIKE